MTRGGKRPGAGAPKGQRKANKKQRYTTRLRPDQIAWLRTRNGAKTIEVLIDALMGGGIMKKNCEACGKQPPGYYVESWIKDEPVRELCCVCVDTMITRIGQYIKEELNIREIPGAE